MMTYITMETENQISLGTLHHLIINAVKEIKIRPDENSSFEYQNFGKSRIKQTM